jgi:hypothetical protein
MAPNGVAVRVESSSRSRGCRAVDPPAAICGGYRAALVLWCTLAWGAAFGGSAWAATCTVPGSYALIRNAVADPNCTVIQLGAQSYPESPTLRRSLTLAGPATGVAIIQGRLTATGTGVVVQLTSLTVANGCAFDALQSLNGARLDADRVPVLLDPGLACPPELPFAATFEAGNITDWSFSQP